MGQIRLRRDHDNYPIIPLHLKSVPTQNFSPWDGACTYCSVGWGMLLVNHMSRLLDYSFHVAPSRPIVGAIEQRIKVSNPLFPCLSYLRWGKL
eukprot:3279758-Amphidinium_carterae.4